MELSHRDQMESSAAVGFLPANTHRPLTFHCHTTLLLYLVTERSCLGIKVAGGGSQHKNNNSLSPHLSSALFTHSCIPPLCFHARRPICGLCIEEAEFSLTVLERDVHSAIHPEPSQCINPWILPATVSLECGSRLFLVLKVCGPQAGRAIARIIKIKTDK